MIALPLRIEGKMEKITPTDLRNRAEQLVRDGKMPTLQQLLAAVADTRQKYSVKTFKTMPTTKEVAPTDYNCAIPSKVYKPNEYTDTMKRYERLIVDLSPILINRKVTVSFIEDSDIGFQGCTKRWKPDSYNFEVNLAFHDVTDWQENYELLLHEMAHHREQSNDHLNHAFYEALNELGAKLAQIALQRPELFPTSIGEPKLVAA
jgi:hypothetical protein